MIPEGWTENDTMIRCHRLRSDVPREGIVRLNCELCQAAISAAPITAAKKGTPGWHIVCVECFGKILPGEQVKFMGRIQRGDETLP